MKIILATWNTAKFKWLSEGFSKVNLPIASINKEKIEEVEENGKTCQENVLIKVRAVGSVPNAIVIGEDSGLFIDALNGFPGVKTVRWMDGSDDDRSIKILEKMKPIPIENRTARFLSAIALLLPDGQEKVFLGKLEGSISSKLVGNIGKGYQRIFLLKNGKTIAESGSSIVKKNDHRDKSMKSAIKFISNMI